MKYYSYACLLLVFATASSTHADPSPSKRAVEPSWTMDTNTFGVGNHPAASTSPPSDTLARNHRSISTKAISTKATASSSPASYPHPPTNTNPAKNSRDQQVSAQPHNLKRIALTLNPMSLLIARFSFNFEYIVAKHHGLIVVPTIWNWSSIVTSRNENTTKIKFRGVEIGYHYYAMGHQGAQGADGFFIGPSVSYMRGWKRIISPAGLSLASTPKEISMLAGMIDIGYQHVWNNGFTVGGGGGLMAFYLWDNLGTDSETMFNGNRILPRGLCTIGFSF